jgi:signal transduction histidine kinase
VDRIDAIVRQLLEFARPAPPKLQPTPIAQLLDETLGFLSNDCLKRQIRVQRAYGDGAETIHADPQQLRQVFLNLLLNSLDAMDGSGGTLSVTTAHHDSQLTITLTDTGCGIPKEHLDHLFDPFFTTKEHGTGLGLSIVQGIIREHGGTITFDSQVGQGTRCTLTFPLEAAHAEGESARQTIEACRRSSPDKMERG